MYKLEVKEHTIPIYWKATCTIRTENTYNVQYIGYILKLHSGCVEGRCGNEYL